MANFTILHMYPDLMNLYGDRGNLICLSQRLRWYGHTCSIESLGLGQSIDFSNIDMIFMGGGSDREQGLVYQDLLKKSDLLWAQIEEGFPALCICGAYQLLGKSYLAADGTEFEGLGFLDFYTQGAKDRLIGNILLECNLEGQKQTVVGFENHGGRTYLTDSSLTSFGRVLKGFGNNGRDKTEGIKYNNLIGTYLHGPLLPKNPHIADYFIKAMSKRKGINLDRQIDDSLEQFAHGQIIKKITR